MSLDQGRSHDELAFLRGLDLFLTLNMDEIIALRKGVKVREISSGDSVILQGEVGRSLFVVKQGTLMASMRSPAGSEIEVGKIGPGQVFGEMSMMTGSARSATILAQTDAVLVEITKDAMDLLLGKDKRLADRISSIINDRTTANEFTMGKAVAN